MKQQTRKSVLSIAGSDSSGGAGIQADIKTIAAHHLFAQTAITSLTAQNTTGVFGVFDASPDFVARQIDVVFQDIRPDAVKVGMVSNAEIVHAIAQALVRNGARNIVVDPVLVATSGSSLATSEALGALREELIPLADVITPNIPEAQVLAGFSIENEIEQEYAATVLAGATGGVGPAGVSAASAPAGEGAATSAARPAHPKAVLVKGGHGTHDANDVLVDSRGNVSWFNAPRIDTENTHGTGCTLSSAIACGLACGKPLPEAIRDAKAYLTGALAAGLNLGKGSGPVDHMWNNEIAR